MPAPRIRVLIVEDDVSIATLLERSLRARFEVRATPDGRRALGLLAAGERYDVVLLDVHLPVMGGIEVFTRISIFFPAMRDRIVFMSAGPSVEEAVLLGTLPNERLMKPFTFAAVRETLDRVGRRERLAA